MCKTYSIKISSFTSFEVSKNEVIRRIECVSVKGRTGYCGETYTDILLYL